MRAARRFGVAGPGALARLALGTGLASLACGAAPASLFRSPVSIPLGAERRPAAIAAGDFNRDGHVDLAVGSEGTGDLTILLGDGRGGFRVAGSFAAGESPTEIFVGDLDHDGNPDLAIANHGVSTIAILLGDGKGSFRPAPGSPLAVHSRPHPHTIDGCDVDGDGNIDLVVDSWGENRLTLLLGDGRGGFRTPGTPIEVGRKPYRNLRLRDIDGDGRCDIVAPSYDRGVVTLLFGDGAGHFRAAPPIAAGPAPFTVAIGDLNRDGKLDLVFENYSGQITDPSDDALTFLLGDGRGGFRLGPRIPTGSAPFDVAVGDVDGDGFADAVVVNGGSRDLTVALGGPDGLSAARTARIPVGRRIVRAVLADFNGDGKADVAAVSGEDHDVTILLAR
jgi:FG-GAP-like repeat